MRQQPRQRFLSLLLGVGLVASACSSSTEVPDDPAALAAYEAAVANADGLTQSDNAIDTEVLDVLDGSVSTLRGAVDGDRPVLLWFWAPH